MVLLTLNISDFAIYDSHGKITNHLICCSIAALSSNWLPEPACGIYNGYRTFFTIFSTTAAVTPTAHVYAHPSLISVRTGCDTAIASCAAPRGARATSTAVYGLFLWMTYIDLFWHMLHDYQWWLFFHEYLIMIRITCYHYHNYFSVPAFFRWWYKDIQIKTFK